MGEIYHKDLSYRIVGAAQKVHSALGPGFPEGIYHRALCCELVKQKIPFETEKSVNVYYEGNICGEFRIDILVNDEIVLELKAVDCLSDVHVAQGITYLKATGKKLCLLINFAEKSLETKRVVV